MVGKTRPDTRNRVSESISLVEPQFSTETRFVWTQWLVKPALIPETGFLSNFPQKPGFFAQTCPTT